MKKGDHKLFNYSLSTWGTALGAMIFWGFSFVWSSIVFRYYPPIATIFIRLVISTIFLALLSAFLGKLQRIRKEDVALLLISSFFNPFLYFIGENFGLKHTTPALSAVIIATIPVFTPVAAYVSLKERLTILNFIGICISFSGILVMLIKQGEGFAADPMGVSLLGFAVLSAVIYSIFLKKLTSLYNAYSIITYQNLIGIFLFLPLFLMFDFQDFIKVRPNKELILSILQLAVFASSLAFLFFTMTVERIGVSKANVFSNLIPVFTAIFSFFIIGEEFTIQKIAGIFIVIFGVFLSQMRRNSKKEYQSTS